MTMSGGGTSGLEDGDDVGSFSSLHRAQLEPMGVPEGLYASIAKQCRALLTTTSAEALAEACASNLSRILDVNDDAAGTRVLATPHLASVRADARADWEAAAAEWPWSVLRSVRDELATDGDDRETGGDGETKEDRAAVERVVARRAWERATPYRDHEGVVRIALPCPPFLPFSAEGEEATVAGPFPFAYYRRRTTDGDGYTVAYCGLCFFSGADVGRLTVDPVPEWSCPNPALRHARRAALARARGESRTESLVFVQRRHAEQVRAAHLARQKAEESGLYASLPTAPLDDHDDDHDDDDGGKKDSPLSVYTEASDPFGLVPLATSRPTLLTVTHELRDDLDVLFPCTANLFAPNAPFRVDSSPRLLLNQFPYEGALVRADHLARGVRQQHGSPRPAWAVDAHDLDVETPEFVGAHVAETERGAAAVRWVVTPPLGDPSAPPLVADDPLRVTKLLETDGRELGGGRVARRYVENVVTHNGRRVECCVYVVLKATSNNNNDDDDDEMLPPVRLYAHERVFLRRADDDVATNEEEEETADRSLRLDGTLLGKEHGFSWERSVVPRVHDLLRELFSGAVAAHPAVAKSSRSRSVYGVRFMLERTSTTNDDDGPHPKLVGVDSCPTDHRRALANDDDTLVEFVEDVFRCQFTAGGGARRGIARLL